MEKRTRTLILILVFTMCMAISASATRVYLDGLTPKLPSIYEIRKHVPLKYPKPAEANANLIRLTHPVAGSVITSPFALEGEARGYWYFEATAPFVLHDAKGTEIAAGYVTAIDDWMTEDFVGFEGDLEFEKPETATGTLVLRNANASGDPERDIRLKVPVRFE